MTFPQLGEHREPIPIREIQFEENKANILVLRYDLHGFGGILCLQDRRTVLQVLEHVAKCLSDQELIIHQQDLCSAAGFCLIAARLRYAIQPEMLFSVIASMT